MSNCSKHPLTVIGYSGTHQQLAKAIGNMRYDQTAAVILELYEDITRQAAADRAGGRTQLAGQLEQCAEALHQAHQSMDAVWKICEPHMRQMPSTSQSDTQLTSSSKSDDGHNYAKA